MRRFGKTVLVLLVSVLTMFNIYYWLLPLPIGMASELGLLNLELTDRDKVLVFAPHPDDESVGTAGIIQRATEAGSTVKVVFVTCGDGFRHAAQRRLRVVRTNGNTMQELGKIRQVEAWSALSLLGVLAENVVFLGYPDRGLASLWQQNWSVNTTYCSPYTGVAVSPYCNGYTAEAAYCGQVLLKDIEALLREEKPTVILFPSNYDGHPDHWATNAFVSYALEELKLQGWQFKPKVYNYLVHYTDWPRPWGANLMQELGPPAGIAGESQWLTLWLSWSERIKKHNAILLHKSQVAVMQGFLTSFARSTELFHSYPSELILEPDEQTVLATDAHGDSLGDRLDRYTDITCLSGKLNDTELELALSLTGAVRSNVKCELELVVLGGNLPRQRLLLSYPAKELPSGITAKSEGNEILFTVPRSLLGKAPLLFVAAETYQGQMRADRLCQIRVQLR